MLPLRPCANDRCMIPFRPGKPWAKYCSHKCADAARHRKYYRRKKARRARAEQLGIKACLQERGRSSP
jgi:hypothetical protein